MKLNCFERVSKNRLKIYEERAGSYGLYEVIVDMGSDGREEYSEQVVGEDVRWFPVPDDQISRLTMKLHGFLSREGSSILAGY